MKRRRLGQSDIFVTPIGLGCWQFSNRVGLAGKHWPSLTEIPAQDIIGAALDGGVNWFDTAEIYGRGASEACLAAGLKASGADPGEVVVATKWHPLGRTARSLVNTIEERKRRLDGYPVGLYQIHAPFSFSSIRVEMDAMARLIEGGHIRAAGLSNYTATQMRRAHRELARRGHPLVSNQVRYNLLHREIESNGILDTAQELGMTLIAYSPLGQGLLTGKFHDDPTLIKTRAGWRRFRRSWWQWGLRRSAPVIAELKRIAKAHGATPGQVALNWLVSFHGDTVVAIPGATKVRHAQQNATALEFRLTPKESERLDEVSKDFA